VIELGAIRADDVNFPLFVHVLAAMVLVGSLLLTATVLTSAWRDGSVGLTRLAYRTLLVAVLPVWLVTRVFAQILLDKPVYEAQEDATWMTIGFVTSEPGLLLIVGAAVAAGLGLRRARREGGPVGPAGRVAAVFAWIMLAGYVLSIWAMTTKPE
jgi:hypothetical protein